MNKLTESSFSSKAAKFLSTRLGLSLLLLAVSAFTMFAFTNSLFSVYKQNIFFLHSSGMASHMVEKILLDVQGLRTSHFSNHTELLVITNYHINMCYNIFFSIIITKYLISFYRNDIRPILNIMLTNCRVCIKNFTCFKNINLEYSQIIMKNPLLKFLLLQT